MSLAARIEDAKSDSRDGEAAVREGPEKSAGAFRTIKEAADELDVPQHVLRFWETRFTQIRPVKRAGGRRYYRPDDLDLLKGIKHLLHGQGYTIKGAQRVLRERGLRFVQSVGRGEAVAAAPSLQDAEHEAPAADLAPGDGLTAAQRAVLADALADLRACRAALAGLRLPPEPIGDA
ncbi:MerR family transcriptional regulator [Methylobacterium sp. Leaf111]|jgi:DNA-binding transcriptional MerR regulator|uniref:MerR family transcriptional regulator n=1 Tax=Methylobacterium sp. Leaf111 TaxID=1736257 RepID=UPI0006F372E6|nr:MerR family transcriptional regulator [Methylobacterium sp. Leaf89]KQO76400.1 MerR family transcriptional regulator [Methylobacterium sp. Leaf88]KQP75759.1 MerR family transcriptional regulator [Methylobacterium sp. Leaf111]